MGVTEIEPGEFWATLEIGEEPDGPVLDLGFFSNKGHAEVACDVMLFKLRGRSAGSDDRRLPKLDRADEAQLIHSLEAYEHITRQLLRELADRKEDELALALKTEGLAAELYKKLPLKGEGKKAATEEAGPSKPAPEESLAKRKRPEAAAAAAVEPADKKTAAAPSKPVLKKIPPPPVPAVKKEQEKEAEKKEKAVKRPREVKDEEEEEESSAEVKPAKPKSPQKVAKKAKKEESGSEAPIASAAADSDADGGLVEPRAIWLRPSPEWPRGSGKFACFVKREKATTKSTPIPITYFTLAQGMVKEVLPRAEHGTITMVDANDPSRFWSANYNVKDEENRKVGNYRGQRYFRKLGPVQAGMNIEPGDVVYFMKDEKEEPQRVRVGVWKKGSDEAEAFTAKLVGG